jgi:MFS family permease
VFSVRDAILISIVPGLLAAVAMFSAVRHVPKLAVREHVKLRIKIAPVVRSRAGTFLTGIAAFEVGNVAATLLILRASESLSPGRSADRATQIALVLYLAYNLAATLVSIQAGRTIDRSSGIRVLVAGVAMFAVSYVLFATATANVAVLAAAFVLAGLGIGCVETAEHATIAASAPEELRGSAFGLVAAVQSFGNLAASATAGAIWTAVSPRAAFLYLAFWMVVAAGLLIWASQRKESQE